MSHSKRPQFGLGWLFFIVLPFAVMALITRGVGETEPWPKRILQGIAIGSVFFYLAGILSILFLTAFRSNHAVGMFFFSLGMLLPGLIAAALSQAF